MNKTAIVIGATGLIGSSLLDQLLEDETYSKIKIFHRRSTGVSHPKISEEVVDFDRIDEWEKQIDGDVLFSAMGTTIKKAGSKKAQYKIDFTYQYEVAKAAANNLVESYVLVSSSGANAKSKIFYSKIKGELDDAVMELPFKKIIIMRPSILAGNRKENRTGEKIGLALARGLTKIPGLKKYKPIKGETVAKAMIKSIQNTAEYKTAIYTLDEIFKLV